MNHYSYFATVAYKQWKQGKKIIQAFSCRRPMFALTFTAKESINVAGMSVT